MKTIFVARCVCGEDVLSDDGKYAEDCAACGRSICADLFDQKEIADITREVIAKEVNSSTQGPADPMERFEKLLHSWTSNDIELAECNYLRIAFQLGREQGHLENQAGDYENPKP